MDQHKQKRQQQYGWVTVGGAQHYNVKPYMPDMSWLGEPPESRMASRYEVARLIKHRAVVNKLRLAIEKEIAIEAKAFVETPAQRRAQVAKLNELNQKLANVCHCGLCRN